MIRQLLRYIVSKGTTSLVQDAVTDVKEWSTANRLTLNAEKCKELRIDFKLVTQPFDPVLLDVEPLPVVKKAEILGLVMSKTFQWNDNITSAF